MRRADRIPALCLGLFTSCWIALAIAPSHRDVWALENVPTVVLVPLLVATYRRFRFSDRAYVQGTLFLLLHTVGSHYAYSQVPLGDWARDALLLGRNPYDRWVHFAFGALVFLPLRELVFRRTRRLGLWLELFLTACVLVAAATAYELLEWWTVSIADPRAGLDFLGAQGDAWDSQKDVALACAAAVCAAAVEALAERAGARSAVRGPVAPSPESPALPERGDAQASTGCG